MRWLYLNRIDTPGATFTASTEVATLPGSNVAHDHLANPWQTGTSQAAETLTVDLGSSLEASAVVIDGHDLQAGDASIEVRGSTDNFGASNVLVATLTWAAGPIVATFTPTSFRYWRIGFTKDNAAEARTIGRVFLGPYTTTATQPDYDGLDVQDDDLGEAIRAVSGQHYGINRGRSRRIDLDLSEVTDTEREAIDSIVGAVGLATSFWLQIDPTASEGIVSSPFYGRLANLPRWRVAGFDGELRWDAAIAIEEQK